MFYLKNYTTFLFKLPFEISAPETSITRDGAMQAFTALRAQAKNNGVADLSLDEINKEIALTRSL